MRAAIPLLACLVLLTSCFEEKQVVKPGKLTWQIALLTPDQPPETAVGIPYDVNLHYSIADEGPYTWSVTAGSLPPGLVLEPSTTQDSRLYGTPTTAGQFGFTISIDSDVGPVEFVRGVSVLPAGSLTITTTTLGFGSAGIAYGQNVEATGGSGTGYTWSISAGSLPSGLTIDPRDSTLSWGSFSASGNVSQALGGGKLSQVSGMVASHSQPGVFWVHDEDAFFYAIDAAGNVLQEFALNATAQDIEDIAIGPGNVLYLADVGDPGQARTDCRIYRVAEPTVPASPGSVVTVAHDEFWFEYPGGSQDSGTLLVDWNTDMLFLVECVDTPNPRIHRFDTPLDTAWISGNPHLLTQMTSTGSFDATITGGDTSADGRRMILRSFASAREYALPASSGFNMIFSEAGNAVTVPGGQQHEAICYSDNGAQLFTTTELGTQANAPIHFANAAADNGYTTISGTPVSVGTSTFLVRVTDSAGNVAFRQLTISIN
jgi:hypothetical protein